MDFPTNAELSNTAKSLGLNVNSEEIATYSKLLQHTHENYLAIENWDHRALLGEEKYPRGAGRKPSPDENKLNAWYWLADVKGDPKGRLLQGKTVALKDNVCLRGIPLMNGSGILEGYTPDWDATIVTRILDAGGFIRGKAVCENMCLSGASYQTTYGPVRNPYNTQHSAGGSSSGSAALVASGEIDLAIGGDQGGSIRIPASNCGIVGLKPTYGLVPYTGIVPIETTIDHTGPMARSVVECATFLEAIAGKDPLIDQRQPHHIDTVQYSVEVFKPSSDIKIALLTEGFDVSTEDVQQVVRAAAEMMRSSGAFAGMAETSIPNHKAAPDLLGPILGQGTLGVMVHGVGYPEGTRGFMLPSMCEYLREGYAKRFDKMDHTGKMLMVYAEYMRQKAGNRHYIAAQNFVVQLRRDYESAFRDHDLLLMPTLPLPPCKLQSLEKDGLEAYIGNTLAPIANTYPFNVTGHPAITVNAGYSKEGLPIGLMLVGRHFEDATVLRAARQVEETLASLQRQPAVWVK